MRECLPSFSNLQKNILDALTYDWLECPMGEGKPWDKEDGHLKKLIERGFVTELPNGNFEVVTDIFSNPIYQQVQMV